MKKRLLIILLSIFMSFTLLAVNVHADINTIADVLNTADGGFPCSLDDQSIPENAWSTDDDRKMYFSSDKSELVITYMFFTIATNESVTEDGYGNYNAEVTVQASPNPIQVNIKFTMNDDKLIKIDLLIGSTNYCFEPIGTRLTIAKFLETYRSDFPNSANDGWVNSNGNADKMYIGQMTGRDYLLFSNTQDMRVQLSFLLTPSASGKNYIYENSTYSLNFILNNDDKLQSIEFVAPTNYSYLSGTYIAPLTVADVLNTVANFPTSNISGWVNTNGKKIFINNEYNYINVSYNIPLNSVLQKDGNNYKYITGNQSCTFVMTSGVLTSINVIAIMSDFNGEYTPYRFTNDHINKPVGYKGDIEFITNGKYIDDTETHVDVYINDVILSSDKYEVTSASTHVKLKGSYVSTLQAGTYTIKIEMDNYDPIESTFTISSSPSPSGGDSSSKHIILNTGVN